MIKVLTVTGVSQVPEFNPCVWRLKPLPTNGLVKTITLNEK